MLENCCHLRILSPTTNLTEREMYQQIVRHYEAYGVNIAVTDNNHFYILEDYKDRIIAKYQELLALVMPLESITPHRSKLIPFHTGSFLYFLYDDAELVYIGETGNLAARISSHVQDKIFDSVSFLTNVEDRQITEALYINTYRTKYNIGLMSDAAFFTTVLKRIFQL